MKSLNKRPFSFFIKLKQIQVLDYLVKCLFFCSIIGILTGTASALLLISLDWATNYRELHLWIIGFLPFAGLMIGLMYHYWGKDTTRGNNLLIDEVHRPKKYIPFIMAPLVLISTILTHLFGGSAGREGTAVQMGGAIADQFAKRFRLDNSERKLIITIGISAGFASVFGTPFAGAIFAIEILLLRHINSKAILPSLVAAFIADYTCQHIWNVSHTIYTIPDIPEISISNIGYTIVAGTIFGLAAMLFSQLTPFWSKLANYIKYAPLRPFLGGIILVGAIYLLGTTKHIGLGVPTIVAAFRENMNNTDFLLKILLTTFTIGFGFKGGEVTPLFFIGATLGNILIVILPLPMALLAGIGFVGVFSGATNTPFACTIMGMELFGYHCGIYVAISCFIAYFCSGKRGIYSSQVISQPKMRLYSLFFPKR